MPAVSGIKIALALLEILLWLKRRAEAKGQGQRFSDAMAQRFGGYANDLLDEAARVRAGTRHDDDSVRNDPDNIDSH